MFCRYCGKENSDDANFCNSCGKSLSGESTPNNTQQPAPARPAAELTANLAIASLIFGICSIPMAFLALWLSLLCAICAIVLGKISLDQKRPGKELTERLLPVSSNMRKIPKNSMISELGFEWFLVISSSFQ
ncbi:MAG: zinc-ribbon domain-containing protein [Ruminococcus sp.]|uniref:zinc-ribbon domain-containing protein n=1 Tax=Ruminococcus sp. TaxID=41978 RepID=UPI0025FDAD41|nr:zinc-ribbon domain-containing protein [Ruminococcus sp.]MCR4793594.1 zinc-ribbon domain-containing protein [Ruminococcus sp.]